MSLTMPILVLSLILFAVLWYTRRIWAQKEYVWIFPFVFVVAIITYLVVDKCQEKRYLDEIRYKLVIIENQLQKMEWQRLQEMKRQRIGGDEVNGELEK